MTTHIERLADLVVGIVESVAPDSISVLLELDAPHATALNTGVPAAFPRLNGYVLIPNEAGATVAYIGWIGIEKSPFPKRSGMKDFGLIDLPFPLRKMKVLPVGTLICHDIPLGRASQYELMRGVVAFPSVGDQVLIPTAQQVEAIVGGKETDKRVAIGSSPLSTNATVSVDPDKLFGRHLAVLGNTGSGKSCTVAGLIRWSLEAATKAIDGEVKRPNARFVVLDPNGEYAAAFADMPEKVRVFRPGADQNPFQLPAWMWNSHEWSALTNAQPGVQRPLLMKALRTLRSGFVAREPLHVKIVRQSRLYRAITTAFIADGSGESYLHFPNTKNCCQSFINLAACMRQFLEQVNDEDACHEHISALADAADEFVESHRTLNRDRYYYDAPGAADFEPFIPLFEALESALPAIAEEGQISEDSPIPFEVGQLADQVEEIAVDAANINVNNFIATLTLRIRSMLADPQLAEVVVPKHSPTLEAWLGGMLGATDSDESVVAIIDLSLLPSDIVHTVIAVLGRVVFEASQRYRRQSPDGRALPTVLVLEEAHTFVKRRGRGEEASESSTALCREAFERISREGRKFGLGLVLSSQRPSELSPTALAQCNTFILHRIVNDDDQELVAGLVPDNVAGLLTELPSLPSRQAILLGWATPIPILVEMNELPRAHCPQSSDPDYWNVWTRSATRPVDWRPIAEEWQRGAPAAVRPAPVQNVEDPDAETTPAQPAKRKKAPGRRRK